MPFGGKFNNFVFHATAAMVERLRGDQGCRGLVTAVSGLLTKPGLTVWGTELSIACRPADLVDRVVEATGVAPLDEDPDGPGVVLTYTTAGPRVSAILELDSGERAVAACDDTALAERVMVEDPIGTSVHVVGRAFSL